MVNTLSEAAASADPPEEEGRDAPLSIFLVGMPGAGKTTIGRHLARLLSNEFVDLDHELERRCGVRVPVIFDLEGEAGFRQRESSVLEECTRRRGIVLATGGGAVLSPDNRRLLHERGLVVYLRARVADLYARTRHDRNRPLLQTADPMAALQGLHAVRDPLYREVAHLTVDTGRVSVPHLVNRIVPMLRTYAREPELLCRK
ncbi:shikimate kinase [Verticiella sediminum]|uniref:Shikimate kinase n=1 Tax=Verticiella sediminum TaxID=1247510 RepID=A0A556A8C5_9BURK|nr:shikimate kinase [Verticiella sediminum]TSH89123.1 shikimate kinase [Verticiella sediminum]